MQNRSPEEFEKLQQVLEHKKEQWYREFRDRMGIEEKQTKLLERMAGIEEEIKGHRMLTENLLHQMDQRFQQVDKRFEQVDKRFEQMDKRFEQVDKRFEQMDKRFEQLIHQMDQRFGQVDKRFEQVDKRFALLTWVMGGGFTLIMSILVILLNYALR